MKYFVITLLIICVFNTITFAQKSYQGSLMPQMSLTVQWDRYIDTIECSDAESVIRHVNLFNPEPNKPTLVKRVYLTGRDAEEFTIFNTEAPSLTNFIMPTGDSDWFDIQFKPNLAKQNSMVREAQLVVISDHPGSDSMDIIYFKGIVHTLGVTKQAHDDDFSFTINSISLNTALVAFSIDKSKKLTFAVYDMLGREVASVKESIYPRGENSIAIRIGNVPNGVYILRITDGALVKSMSFRVVK